MRYVLTLAMILMLAGCGEDEATVSSTGKQPDTGTNNVAQGASQQPSESDALEEAGSRPAFTEPVTAADNSDSTVVLAQVKKSSITDREVISEAKRLLGDVSFDSLSEEVKRNLLESLVIRRRMSQKQLALLSEADKEVIANDVSAYREKLLMKKYLQQFATPAAVTDAMVKEYYLKHPEEFGATDERYYQIVLQKEIAAGEQQGKEIEQVGELKTKQNFVSSAQELVSETPNLLLKKGRQDEALFPKVVSDQMHSLAVGERRFLLHGGRPYFLYLEKIETSEPKPLSQVSAKIRRKLMSVQVKKMMSTIRDQVLTDPEVRFEDVATEWGVGNDATQ